MSERPATLVPAAVPHTAFAELAQRAASVGLLLWRVRGIGCWRVFTRLPSEEARELKAPAELDAFVGRVAQLELQRAQQGGPPQGAARSTVARRAQLSDAGSACGDSHPNAKLSAQDVRRVIDLHAAGVSLAQLAAMFGVSKSAIAHICSGRRWTCKPGVLSRPIRPRREPMPRAVPEAPLPGAADDEGQDDWPRPVPAPLPALPPLRGGDAGLRCFDLMAWTLLECQPAEGGTA